MGNRVVAANAEPESMEELSLFELYDLISKSEYFDTAFYLKQNRDVADKGLDPILHYLAAGARERRAPHPRFDSAHYEEQCAARGLTFDNPLLHFLLEGRVLGLEAERTAESSDGVVDEHWAPDHILASGLFDRAYYNGHGGVHFDSDEAALRHYQCTGYKEGKKPNLYFDPAWYLDKYPDVRAAGVEPLFHYLVQGDSEGRQPSLIFDAAWYRRTYDLPDHQHALVHYLKNRASCELSPIPDFDARFYGEQNKDVKQAGVDPFAHFLFTGYREGRNPSRSFNIKYYVRRYLKGSLEENPLVHYLSHKNEPGFHGALPSGEITVQRLINRYTRPAEAFEECKPLPQSAPRKAKVLAYYLPQFHAFPENDEKWGKGFTEWTNIARGVPRFVGHYQPRVPRDLGFYSLDSPETLRRQVKMARAGGIYGFVFYYYWFNGKRLMDAPIDGFLADPSIDMPFALMWANENWTRRWAGDEQDVLIRQDYDPDDDVRLMSDFVRHFRDPRYIRVQGRPLLMLYRPGIIPNCQQVVGRWREHFQEQFGEDPIFISAQAFNDNDPLKFGLDGAIEFPPHKLCSRLPPLNDRLELLDYDLTASVVSYDDVVAFSLNEPPPPFPLIKTAVTSWDNDARRQGSGMVIANSTPSKYEAWVRELVKIAQKRPFFGESFVCVNAWNEWCESAYLEPDLHYGAAYLNATARAVTGQTVDAADAKLLLVGHDAHRNGAQHLLLNIGRALQQKHGLQIEFLLLGKGRLEEQYRETAPLTIITDREQLEGHLASLKGRGFHNAIVNTLASAAVVADLCKFEIEPITLVHELPRIVRERGLQQAARSALESSRYVVFPAEIVRDQIAAEAGVRIDDRFVILPQGMYQTITHSPQAAAEIRAKLGVREGERLVVGVGYADLRKGFDLFLQLCRLLNQNGSRVHLCWIGDVHADLEQWLAVDIETALAAGTLHMPGFQQNVSDYLSAADAFVLPSREDPFPSVVHEALSAGLPVFAFDQSGGMADFLRRHGMGVVVPFGDTVSMASAVQAEFATPRDEAVVRRRKEFVDEELGFDSYIVKLLRKALPSLQPVTVAVPNYNYARYLPERLATVFQQTYPVEQVLVLDDSSTDDSLRVIDTVAKEWQRDITLIPAATNSGSVFRQWRKGAQEATGEFLWIAEADDRSDPAFLGTLIRRVQESPDICLGFTDSRTIHTDGSPLGESYKGYYSSEQEPDALTESFVMDGTGFVKRYLSVRNLILNVSAVVWRRAALLRALDACEPDLESLRVAGDWRLYLEVLSQPGARIAYVSDPLNVHRRHRESVTHSVSADQHVDEISRCHRFAVDRFQLPGPIQEAQAGYLAEVHAQLSGTPLETSPFRERRSRFAPATPEGTNRSWAASPSPTNGPIGVPRSARHG